MPYYYFRTKKRKHNFCDICSSDFILIIECHLSTVRFSSSLLLHFIAIEIFMTLLISYYIDTVNIPFNQLMSPKNIPEII